MPRLRIEQGKNAGKTIELSKPTILGRGETVQLQIADAHASREHCKVFEQAGVWVVADLSSSNGTKVDGVKISRRNLNPGDKIVIGETVIVFEATAAAAKAAPAAAPAAKTAAPPAATAKPSGPSAASAKKDEAFASARAQAAGGKRAAATKPAAATAAAAAADSGIKVSDHVLQFHKVDVNKASVMDVDLTQSAGLSRFLVFLACVAFLGGVVFLVVKLMQ